MKTSDKIIKFFNNLVPASVPGKIEILDPYGNEAVSYTHLTLPTKA